MHVEIMAVTAVVAVACALPGTFLVLKKMSLMSDAISHSILLGIVMAFGITHQVQSWLTVPLAVGLGLVTVWGSEWLVRSRLIKEDAAIGLIFPLFFSLAMIGIHYIGQNAHIDQDAVLLGELALAPLRRLVVAGMDWGPVSLWTVGLTGLLSLGLVIRFYHPLSVTLFDPELADSLGLSPRLGRNVLMAMVSMTTVVCFDAVGSVLVVALMVTPPCIALLLTRQLKWVLWISCVMGILASLLGYGLAVWVDATIAGSMAGVLGIFFLLAFAFSPSQGIVTQTLAFKRQAIGFACKALAVQLYSHEGTLSESDENTLSHMVAHMGWDKAHSLHVIRAGVDRG
ncbi:metal ABC transporter permease, partial [bacterium]|nr:metal ABC transporter permease [bacterium]